MKSTYYYKNNIGIFLFLIGILFLILSRFNLALTQIFTNLVNNGIVNQSTNHLEISKFLGLVLIIGGISTVIYEK